MGRSYLLNAVLLLHVVNKVYFIVPLMPHYKQASQCFAHLPDNTIFSDLNLCSVREDGGTTSPSWTIETQSWETGCRICCLANQDPQSVRVKCKRVCQCKYRLPSVSITLLLSPVLQHSRVPSRHTCAANFSSIHMHPKVRGFDSEHMFAPVTQFHVNCSIIMCLHFNFLTQELKFGTATATAKILNCFFFFFKIQ